jgi:hypothetical protein
MKAIYSFATAVGILLGASAAQAATYTLTFTGDDFTSFTGDKLVVTLSNLGPGRQGWLGGPLQTWAFSSSSQGAGWVDFYQDGKTIGIEGNTVSNPYLAASSSFFSTTAPGSWQTLSFTGIVHNSGTETIPLVNAAWNAPQGLTDTLRITAVPESSTWAMMLVGFAALGLAGYRRNKAAALAA